MRPLLLLVAVTAAASGCVPRERYLAKSRDVEVLQKDRDAQAAEVSRMQAKLIELQAAYNELEARRNAERARIDRLEDVLIRASQARDELANVQEQLVARQKEIQRLNEQLSAVWYNSALGRAKRAADPQDEKAADQEPTSEAGQD
jgi:predicted RNase H-like nuclease (RuvC/YqgF family)